MNSVEYSVINSVRLVDPFLCITYCYSIKCPMIVYDRINTICFLYTKKIAKQFLIDSDKTDIYINRDLSFYLDSSLINYWPFDNNLNDLVSANYNFKSGVNYTYSLDRFNKEKSSVYLENGYLEAADGIYFNGDFTISVWVKPISIVPNNERVIDFACGEGYHNVIIGITSNINKAYVIFFDGGSPSGQIGSNIELTLNQWHHLVFTMKDTDATFFINGSIAGQKISNTFKIQPVNRNRNYVGKSNWASDAQLVNCHFDDLIFLNRALNQKEILALFDN